MLQNNIKELVRIGIQNTNFNYSQKELIQLKQWLIDNPNKIAYIWSNVLGYNNVIGTRPQNKLFWNIIKHNRVKIGFTVTPYLNKFIEPLLNPKYIDSVIYKFVLNDKTEYINNQVIEYVKKNNINLMLLPQRFRRNDNFEKFTSKDNVNKYKHERNFKRLDINEFSKFTQRIKEQYNKTYPCGLLELGCEYCLNCYRVNNLKPIMSIKGLDLSSSGICQLNCVDCYAKYNSLRCNGKINLDSIKGNTKTNSKDIADKLKKVKEYKVNNKMLVQ